MSDSADLHRILILCYSCSSLSGVGGRRWSKFSAALADNGHKVTYLCAANELGKNEIHADIRYETFSSSYPTILSRIPSSAFEKIQYRLALGKQKKRTPGNYYDKAVTDRDIIAKRLKRIVKDSEIDTVIISGAPFSLLTLGPSLKQDFPQLKLICDLRDPWTWGHGYGMQTLNPVRMQKEEQAESLAFLAADAIIVASRDIETGLLAHYPMHSTKVKTIVNGIESGNDVQEARPIGPDDLVLITHIGSINIGTEKYYRPLFKHIAENRYVKLRVIGNGNKEEQDFLLNLKADNIEIIPRVSEGELQDYLQESNLFLMFKKDGFENSFPSKFLDYIRAQRPILAFTGEGAVSEEIQKFNLGKVYTQQIDALELENVVQQVRSGSLKFNLDYDWSKFSVRSLVRQIEEIRENLSVITE